MQDVFLERLNPFLSPGMSILDVGAGRNPTIRPEDRPRDCRYVGIDISADELGKANPGSYTDAIVHDVTNPLPELGLFDLILSWQVLEHVRSLRAALENLGAVLRPGGAMLAQTSGSFAVFALLSRLLPHRSRAWLMERLLGHPRELKFPTRYDRCRAGAIEHLLKSWSSVDLVCFYRGATYFAMARPLQRAYLAYENVIARHRVRSLATHYLIVATR
jgi:2-polyprenyl-6-hydroxyphenyl methylase/3-demethylubiquinone-9 3-methyltransferase